MDTARSAFLSRIFIPAMDCPDEEKEIRANELKTAEMLVEGMSAKWNPKQYRDEYREALTTHQRARARVLQAQLEQADAQISLIDEQLARTRIVAPFDAIVVKGDLSQSLGAPVERGNVLFELAPLDAYRVIMKVDERDVTAVSVGQGGSLALSSMPHDALPLEVEKITPVSVVEEGRNFFRVETRVIGGVDKLRPGMEGIGKIHVERRKLGWRARLRRVASGGNTMVRAQRAGAWPLGGLGGWRPSRHFPQFPNYLVRTNGFMASREVLLRVRIKPVVFKLSAFMLESGHRGLTRQVMDMNLKALVVDRIGRADADGFPTVWTHQALGLDPFVAMAVGLLFILSLVPFAIIIWNHWVGGRLNQWQTIQSEMNGWIRGIGTLLTAASSDSGVAMHVNDVYLNTPRIFETEYYDMEQLEVLRGPQGTLFGRNATGGAINITTKQPTTEPDRGLVQRPGRVVGRGVHEQRAAPVVGAPAGREELLARPTERRPQRGARPHGDSVAAPSWRHGVVRGVGDAPARVVHGHALPVVRQAERPQGGEEPQRRHLHAQEPHPLAAAGSGHVGADVRLREGADAGHAGHARWAHADEERRDADPGRPLVRQHCRLLGHEGCEQGWLDAINLCTGRRVGSVGLEAAPMDVALSPDEEMLYVTLSGGGKVATLRRDTLALRATIHTAGRPQRLAFDPHGRYAFIANEHGWVDIVR